MDIKLALMTGVDIPIPEIQLTLHQPTIKEISYLGEKDFFMGIQCLSIQKNMVVQDESLLSTTSNFQIFMTIMSDKTTADKKACVLQVMNLLMPSKQIIMTPRSILINSTEGNLMIDEGNFESFQKAIGDMFCLHKTDQSSFNPGSKKAKEIAEKLMKARQKVAAQKAAENGEGSTFAQYISTLTVGLASMSLQECINLTVYQLYDLVERYSLYINWDIDLKSRLAGAKADKPLENWMKNIH